MSAEPRRNTVSYDESRRYYDDFSERYEAPRARGYHALIDELEVGVVAPHAKGATVLEAGCGTGLILEKIARIAGRAVGVDLSEGMVQKARARRLDVVMGSITELPFADASFDVVYSFKVLAHIPDVGRALEEAVRVTRPGGTLVLEFYNPRSLRYLAKKVTGPQRIGRRHDEADVYTKWHNAEDVRRMLPAAATLVELHGIRVFTPMARVHDLPLVAPVFDRLERWSVRSPLAPFGGFLVAVARRH